MEVEKTMTAVNPDFGHRDRQILCGLFLSKFDQEGLEYLGFDGFTEAFNTLAYSLQAKPASIKNYRDELDPYFPNARAGWHKRPLREHCRCILEAYKNVGLSELGEMIKRFLVPATEAESIPEVERVLNLHDPKPSASFANRLITGRAAEQYFIAHYIDMSEFAGASVVDTTAWGCGFDFKLTRPSHDSFSAVEVKGLRTRCGQIQMTELEFAMAEALKDRYYLVLVRNFVETPFHSVINNPVKSSICFTRVERKEIRFSWNANIVE
jgi:hypothetical protein